MKTLITLLLIFFLFGSSAQLRSPSPEQMWNDLWHDMSLERLLQLSQNYRTMAENSSLRVRDMQIQLEAERQRVSTYDQYANFLMDKALDKRAYLLERKAQRERQQQLSE